jgi:hypothetical protein
MPDYIETDPFKFRLCYVDSRDNFAWFTSIPLDRQWGDDWDDSPYEHNAGEPYDTHYDPPKAKKGVERTREEHKLVKVAWQSLHATPCTDYANSPYSVQAINAGNCAWLMAHRWNEHEAIRPIAAGTTLRDFIKKIEEAGGSVYLPTSLAPQYVAIIYCESQNSASLGPEEVG